MEWTKAKTRYYADKQSELAYKAWRQISQMRSIHKNDPIKFNLYLGKWEATHGISYEEGDGPDAILAKMTKKPSFTTHSINKKHTGNDIVRCAFDSLWNK